MIKCSWVPTKGNDVKNVMFLTLILVSFSAVADVRMDYSDGSFVMFSGDHVVAGDKDGHAIFEAGKDTFIIVNHKEKNYMEVSETFAEDVASAMSAKMEEMLADVPPEQRAMIEQSMKGMMPGGGAMPEPPKMTVNKTGKQDNVAGFDCSEVEVSYSGRIPDMVSCVATPKELGISNKDFESMAAAMRSMSRMAGREDDDESDMDFEGMGGIPIRTRVLPNGSEDELVSLSKDNISEDQFAVPAGYTKVSMDDMMMR